MKWMDIVAYSLKARIMVHNSRPITTQQPVNIIRGIVFSAQSVSMAAHATMECHVIAKQQLHCKRETMFSTRSVPRCYKKDHLAVAVAVRSW
jgi:hypothetical protein